jgi:hypothetical protein
MLRSFCEEPVFDNLLGQRSLGRFLLRAGPLKHAQRVFAGLADGTQYLTTV